MVIGTPYFYIKCMDNSLDTILILTKSEVRVREEKKMGQKSCRLGKNSWFLSMVMVVAVAFLMSGCKAGKEETVSNSLTENSLENEVQETIEPETSSQGLTGTNEVSTEVVADTLIDSEFNRVTVHDPSIIKAKDTYYVFGSHVVAAKSDDLVSWSYVKNSNVGYSINNEVFPDGEKTFAEPLKWTKGAGNSGLWAPDVIYNENLGKYCLYMSIAGGANTVAAIALATSDEVEGPYTYVETLVYSGFTAATVMDTDVLSVLGETVLPARYTYDGVSSNAKWPAAIDATIFEDAAGAMWMVYGSMSGGIFVLPIDEITGKIDRAISYQVGENTDPYFGTRIAGGNKQTGEGPFILYDGETGFYYLFSTYGYLTSGSGYHMRLFRSTNPEGPYVDAAGNSAIITSGNNASIGIKLFGDYRFGNMQLPYVSGGHCSAFIDGDGKRYLIYHTRGIDRSNKEGHQIRVHQMLVNEEGWLTIAPYEYAGETIPKKGYNIEDVTGDYELLLHGLLSTTSNVVPVTPVLIRLNDDGSVTGSAEGSWTLKNGTPYATIAINGTNYSGVFLKQYDENAEKSTERDIRMTFTAISEQNDTIWGSKTEVTDETSVLYDSRILTLPSSTKANLTLPTSGSYGSTILWTSDREEVISTSGIVTRSPEENIKVTLTAEFTKGAVTEQKTYVVYVEKGLLSNTDNEEGIIAKYTFDSGKELEDASGNGYNLINHGVTFKDGAAVFDGSSYFEIPGQVVKSELLTICIEFKVNNFDNTNPLISFGDGSELYFDINVDSKEVINAVLSKDGLKSTQSSSSIPAGVWKKFAFNSGGTDSIDGYAGGSIASLDGQRAWRGKTFGALVGFIVDGTSSYIGRDQLGNYLMGEITEITIYNYYIGETPMKEYTQQ